MIGLDEDEGITGKEAVLSTPPRSILRNSRLVIIEGNIGERNEIILLSPPSLLSLSGVGKTTLAKKLSHSLDYKLFLEPTIENPYLERFYAQPKKYALSLQLWILRQRYNTYVEAVRHVLMTGLRTCMYMYLAKRVGHETTCSQEKILQNIRKFGIFLKLIFVVVGEGAILDRSVFSDVVFANVCTKEGYITPEGNETKKYHLLKRIPLLTQRPKPRDGAKYI